MLDLLSKYVSGPAVQQENGASKVYMHGCGVIDIIDDLIIEEINVHAIHAKVYQQAKKAKWKGCAKKRRLSSKLLN